MHAGLNRSTLLAVGNVLAAVGVLWFGLRVSAQNKRLQNANAVLRTTAEKPYLIRNFDLDILPFLRPVSVVSFHSKPARRILLFGKDGCNFCVQQLPWWKRLIAESSEHGLFSEVWLISTNAGRDFEAFAREIGPLGLPVQRYAAITSAGFAVGTGVAGVPTTVVTDEDRVLLVYAGIMNEELLRESVKIITEPTASARFLRRGAVERVSRGGPGTPP